MSKYSFLVYHKEYEDFLLKLQALGVLHVTQRHKPEEVEELRAVLEHRARLRSLGKQLDAFELPKEDTLPDGGVLGLSEISSLNGADLETYVTDQLARYESLNKDLEALDECIREQEIWGEYSLERVAELDRAGYALRCYVMPLMAYTDAYRQEHETVSVARVGMLQYFVTLGHRDAPLCPEAELLPLPEQSLSDMKASREGLSAQLHEQERSLAYLAPSLKEGLEAYDKDLESQFSLGSARLQAESEAGDKLMLLEGWVPRSEAPALEAALASTGYYYCECSIEEGDSIPIKLKNGAFARLFEPITRMFSLPNYGEIDQTAMIAPFFMLFFGLCLGDAAYGLLIFLVATYYKMKLPKGDEGRDLCSLGQVLGGGATLIGLATGAVFGTTLPYAQEKTYILNQDNLMTLSVILGLVQIFFAKFIAAYKTQVQRGLKYALAPYAWLFFLLGLGAMFGLPMLGWEYPAWVSYAVYALIGVSALFVFFYNTPGKNPFLNFGVGLWNSYNVFSGLVGDTLSYIRLFAIGLTGGVLGGVFNNLAIDSTESLPIYLRLPVMLIVLLLGHGINIGLAMISSVVHPMRLIFVEYYKNSEFEGGGKPYAPLK